MTSGDAVRAIDHYSREVREFRIMNADEIRALRPGQSVRIMLLDGTVGRVKVNGRVRTWKRDAARIEVPLKYGLWEYMTWSSLTDDRRPLMRPTDGCAW